MRARDLRYLETLSLREGTTPVYQYQVRSLRRLKKQGLIKLSRIRPEQFKSVRVRVTPAGKRAITMAKLSGKIS